MASRTAARKSPHLLDDAEKPRFCLIFRRQFRFGLADSLAFHARGVQLYANPPMDALI